MKISISDSGQKEVINVYMYYDVWSSGKKNTADTVLAPITSLTQHKDLLFPLLCQCGSNIHFANMACGFNKKIGAKTRHEQIDRNHKASKSLKRKPRWTDSFPKASHDTCHHRFFPHYPDRAKKQLQTFPLHSACTAYHCIKTCYIYQFCIFEGAAHKKDGLELNIECSRSRCAKRYLAKAPTVLAKNLPRKRFLLRASRGGRKVM